jgi:hypothetical protein
MSKELAKELSMKGTEVISNLAVESLSTLIKRTMEKKGVANDNRLNAVDELTEVCREEVPKAACKAVFKLFDKKSKKSK